MKIWQSKPAISHLDAETEFCLSNIRITNNAFAATAALLLGAGFAGQAGASKDLAMFFYSAAVGAIFTPMMHSASALPSRVAELAYAIRHRREIQAEHTKHILAALCGDKTAPEKYTRILANLNRRCHGIFAPGARLDITARAAMNANSRED
ncbi:MAG: hypothetical protein LBI17_02245 [Rickettsiales bacterium]|jgi:hypothetical protein|nr:hypothetical protein [Rickettsiales bacterium]